MKSWLSWPVMWCGARWPRPWLLRKVRSYNRIQLTQEQLIYMAETIRRKGPVRLLVFGLGRDSSFWARLNRGGETVFLEDNPEWFALVKKRDPMLTAHLVAYGTRMSQWRELLGAEDRLAMDLPAEVLRGGWDVVLVDAPAGYEEPQPGRMKSIFLSTRLGRPGAEVFVHDCEREIEREYCDRFLGEGNLRHRIEHLRHYRLIGGV